MASVKDVATLYQNLKTEWAKKPSKLDKCGELLNKIKVNSLRDDYAEFLKLYWEVTRSLFISVGIHFDGYMASLVTTQRLNANVIY